MEPVKWPLRSTDLSPLVFFSFAVIWKTTQHPNKEDLRERIKNGLKKLIKALKNDEDLIILTAQNRNKSLKYVLKTCFWS